MLDLIGFYFATQHPAFYLVCLLLALGLGYGLGLYGYAQASRDAYRRLIAAQKRPSSYVVPESAQ